MVSVFDVITYMDENNILLSNYIYLILVLELMWFIQNKESAISLFLSAIFLPQ